jgi:hypothetical protein
MRLSMQSRSDSRHDGMCTCCSMSRDGGQGCLAAWLHVAVARLRRVANRALVARSRCATPGLAARYPQAGVHWSAVLTTRLNDMVKLVGPTISCEPAYLAGDFAKERHQNAHVQSYVIATDQARAERPAVSLRSRSTAPADLASSHQAQLSRDALPRRLALVCCSATSAFLNATRI